MPAWLRVLFLRIHGTFSRRRLDDDFEAEAQAHLAMLADENIRYLQQLGSAAWPPSRSEAGNRGSSEGGGASCG